MLAAQKNYSRINFNVSEAMRKNLGSNALTKYLQPKEPSGFNKIK